MIVFKTSHLALSSALFALTLSVPTVAGAQLRVDTTLHVSSGSCAGCDLSNKRMNGMTLKNANFSGSLFNNSNLSGGKLDGTDLTGAHFRRALMYGVTGEQVIMRGAVLEDATLVEAALSNSSLRQANLHRADLSRGHFANSDFQSANLTGAIASNVDFTRSNFDRARFDNADLSGAKLDGGQFTGVRFGPANLAGASLIETNLSDADLRMATGLKQAQLDAACGNLNTRLPAGLSIGYCEGASMTRTPPAADELPENVRDAAARLDRALIDVETLIASTRDGNTRSRLQRIHRDLTQSRDSLSGSSDR